MNTAHPSHTEELLAKHIDGALSASEEREFTMLLATNPAFAEEVRAMTEFEEFLHSSELPERWLRGADTEFLAATQRQMAKAVTGSSAAPTESIISAGKQSASAITTTAKGILTGSFLTKTLIIAVVCGAAGVGLMKYYSSSPSEERANIPAQSNTQSMAERYETTAPLPSAARGRALSAEHNDAEAKSNHVSQKAELQSSSSERAMPAQERSPQQALQQNPASANTTTDHDAQANISIDAHNKQAVIIEQLVQQLRNYEQGGDNVSAAYTARQLGMLMRQTGHLEESASYFSKAIKAAQNLKLRELEGETLAEQALLYRATGNPDKAITTLREAVRILTEVSGSALSKWTKELERWEKQ